MLRYQTLQAHVIVPIPNQINQSIYAIYVVAYWKWYEISLYYRRICG